MQATLSIIQATLTMTSTFFMSTNVSFHRVSFSRTLAQSGGVQRGRGSRLVCIRAKSVPVRGPLVETQFYSKSANTVEPASNWQCQWTDNAGKWGDPTTRPCNGAPAIEWGWTVAAGATTENIARPSFSRAHNRKATLENSLTTGGGCQHTFFPCSC
jgi:hypothetical protein